jgi:hypothetical protein
MKETQRGEIGTSNLYLSDSKYNQKMQKKQLIYVKRDTN